MFTHFSKHAVQRLAQRTKLQPDDLVSILDGNRFARCGEAPGSFREHLVFYSVPDAACFVAVRAKLSGKLITVWPLEYQANLAWAVDEAHCERARRLELEHRANLAPHETSRPTTFVVSVQYVEANGKLKSRQVLKACAADYEFDMSLFIDQISQSGEVKGRAEAAGLHWNTALRFTVRLGKRRAPVVVDLSNDEPADRPGRCAPDAQFARA